MTTDGDDDDIKEKHYNNNNQNHECLKIEHQFPKVMLPIILTQSNNSSISTASLSTSNTIMIIEIL